MARARSFSLRRIRMKSCVVVAGVALATSASFLPAQASSTCPVVGPVPLATQDACQKAVDLFQFMAPQLGGAITGGNATLGQGGSLGGPGHFTIGVRVNAVRGSLPRVDDASVRPVITGARSSAFPTSDTFVPRSEERRVGKDERCGVHR